MRFKRAALVAVPLTLFLTLAPLSAAWAEGDDGATALVADGSYSSYSPQIQTLMAFAHEQIGKPYVAGATGWAWDCSSLTAAAYARVGIDMPAYSFTQAHMGSKVTGEIRPGDLIFMWGHGHGNDAANGHVAIATSAFTMISASNPRDGVHEVRIPSGLTAVRRFVS
jgi:cell wall-associated NlpC family hydrolase